MMVVDLGAVGVTRGEGKVSEVMARWVGTACGRIQEAEITPGKDEVKVIGRRLR